MNKFKHKKNISIKKIIIIIIASIILITNLLLNTIAKTATNNITYIGKTIINNINTNVLNNNIKPELFKKYQINDLIIINYNNEEITNVNYNIENAYQVLLDIKKGVISNINNNMDNLYNYKYLINNNNVIIEMPFYNNTNNVFLTNLGPKIKIQLSLIRLIDGNISTKITTYGINSLLVEIYINISITSSIVIPNLKTEELINNYSILLSSKVVQGKIPSIYNNNFEQKSEKIIT